MASAGEAVELRNAGITGQILILGYTPPCQFEDLVHYHLTQTVVDLPYGRLLNDFGRPVLVHVGIDTVKLKGNGFKVMVQEGDQVKRGAVRIWKISLKFGNLGTWTLEGCILI